MPKFEAGDILIWENSHSKPIVKVIELTKDNYIIQWIRPEHWMHGTKEEYSQHAIEQYFVEYEVFEAL